MRSLSSLTLLLCLSFKAFGQETSEQPLRFNKQDLQILQKADSLLSDSLKWNRHDDRECADDIANGKYSLYCALYKASVDVTGAYVHRRAALQLVRYTIEKHGKERCKEHRLMDWNNHPNTTFTEVKMVLKESMEVIRKQMK